jgi:hypothetical protein
MEVACWIETSWVAFQSLDDCGIHEQGLLQYVYRIQEEKTNSRFKTTHTGREELEEEEEDTQGEKLITC